MPTFSFWLRATGFGLGAFACTLFFVMNVAISVHCLVTRRHVSHVLLVGPLLGTVAFVVAPWPGFRSWWWTPWVAEWGCWVVAGVVWMLTRRERVGPNSRPDP